MACTSFHTVELSGGFPHRQLDDVGAEGEVRHNKNAARHTIPAAWRVPRVALQQPALYY